MSEYESFSFPKFVLPSWQYAGIRSTDPLRYTASLYYDNGKFYFSPLNLTMIDTTVVDTIRANSSFSLNPGDVHGAEITKIFRNDDGDYYLVDSRSGCIHIIDGRNGDYLCSLIDVQGRFFSLETAAIVTQDDASMAMRKDGYYDIYIGQKWSGDFGLRRFLIGTDIVDPEMRYLTSVEYITLNFTLPARSRVNVKRIIDDQAGSFEYVKRGIIMEAGRKSIDVPTENAESIKIEVLPEGVNSYINCSVQQKEVYFTLQGLIRKNERSYNMPAEIVSLDLYPNPAQDNLQILVRSVTPGVYNMTIIDALGRTKYSHQISSASKYTTFSTYIRNLPPGMYSVIIHGEATRVFKSFIKN
jgi:hypothetical protein